jgi:hypothetical protein
MEGKTLCTYQPPSLGDNTWYPIVSLAPEHIDCMNGNKNFRGRIIIKTIFPLSGVVSTTHPTKKFTGTFKGGSSR